MKSISLAILFLSVCFGTLANAAINADVVSLDIAVPCNNGLPNLNTVAATNIYTKTFGMRVGNFATNFQHRRDLQSSELTPKDGGKTSQKWSIDSSDKLYYVTSIRGVFLPDPIKTFIRP